MIKDIVYALGDFFTATFKILPVLGNIPNFLFIAIGSVFFIYWLGEMRKHKKAGEN